jgi:hypothetical protein
LRGLEANHTACGMTRCTPLALGVALILIWLVCRIGFADCSSFSGQIGGWGSRPLSSSDSLGCLRFVLILWSRLHGLTGVVIGLSSSDEFSRERKLSNGLCFRISCTVAAPLANMTRFPGRLSPQGYILWLQCIRSCAKEKQRLSPTSFGKLVSRWRLRYSPSSWPGEDCLPTIKYAGLRASPVQSCPQRDLGCAGKNFVPSRAP